MGGAPNGELALSFQGLVRRVGAVPLSLRVSSPNSRLSLNEKMVAIQIHDEMGDATMGERSMIINEFFYKLRYVILNTNLLHKYISYKSIYHIYINK